MRYEKLKYLFRCVKKQIEVRLLVQFSFFFWFRRLVNIGPFCIYIMKSSNNNTLMYIKYEPNITRQIDGLINYFT